MKERNINYFRIICDVVNIDRASQYIGQDIANFPQSIFTENHIRGSSSLSSPSPPISSPLQIMDWGLKKILEPKNWSKLENVLIFFW